VFLIYALQYLNIADAIVISTSAPVFVSILAYAFLKEKCGVLSIITAIVTLVGVIIIAKPPIITGAVEFDDKLMVRKI
jgi:drug/metabolite transporter (DMT)-like permease